MPHIKIATCSAMEISVFDRWNAEKRHKEGRINITVSGSDAIALSNAFSKIVWELARANMDLTD